MLVYTTSPRLKILVHIAASEKLGGNPDFGLFTTFKRPLRIHHSVPIICGVEGSLGGIHMCIRVESERKKVNIVLIRLYSYAHMYSTKTSFYPTYDWHRWLNTQWPFEVFFFSNQTTY